MQQRRRTIRSTVTRAGIFLLFGAIVNVAVAWFFAMFLTSQSQDFDLSIAVSVETRNQIRVANWWAGSSAGATFMTMYAKDPRSPGASLCVQALRAGWPASSVYGEEVMTVIPRGWPSLGTKVSSYGAIGLGGPNVTLYPYMLYFLPICPVWPGFAINTLFYAAILRLLFAAPGALRRRRRIKRGLCPSCAYPVGASPVCTECGKPVTVRSVESASS